MMRQPRPNLTLGSNRDRITPEMGNECQMSTQREMIIKPKLGLLELTKRLGNVSQACQIMTYSRNTFY